MLYVSVLSFNFFNICFFIVGLVIVFVMFFLFFVWINFVNFFFLEWNFDLVINFLKCIFCDNVCRYVILYVVVDL